MRRTIWIALFILALVASSDAQSPAVAICPTLIVTGPAGVNVPGDTMTFVADLSGEVPKSITFHWKITDGIIVGGEGTRQLEVRYQPDSSVQVIQHR